MEKSTLACAMDQISAGFQPVVLDRMPVRQAMPPCIELCSETSGEGLPRAFDASPVFAARHRSRSHMHIPQVLAPTGKHQRTGVCMCVSKHVRVHMSML